MKKVLLAAIALSLLAGGAVLLDGGKPAPVYQGKPISSWIEELGSTDYQIREQAAEAIGRIGPEASPFLIRALRSRDEVLRTFTLSLGRWLPFLHLKLQPNPALLREGVAEQLGQMAPRDETALGALICSLGEKDRNVLSAVQRALRRLGLTSVPSLVKALSNRDPHIREGAVEVLIDLGAEAQAARPALILALKDRDDGVRCRAARALGLAGPGGAELIEALMSVLDDKVSKVRLAAAESLGRLGAAARVALPVLRQRLSDTDVSVRVGAARSLWQIDQEAAQVVPVLIQALNDPIAGWQAVFVLGEIGPKAEQAAPALIQTLKRERVSRPLRSPPSSALALGQIGPAAAPALIETLQNEQAHVRTGAAIALGFMGRDAKAAVPALAALLRDSDPEVRQASALSLAMIAPQTKDLLPILVELTHDDDIFISGAAMAALRKNHPGLASKMGLE
jgi:HEAT repeat protein